MPDARDGTRRLRLILTAVGIDALLVAAAARASAIRLAVDEPTAVETLGPRIDAAWLASLGDLAGWTVRSHVGPLAAALYAPAAHVVERPESLAAVVVSIEGAISVALAAACVRDVRGPLAAAVGVIGLVALTVPFLADAPASLALVAAAARLAAASEVDDPRRSLAAGVYLALAIAWTPLAMIPAAALIGGAAAAGALVAPRRSLLPSGRALAVPVAAVAAWSVGAALLGGRSSALLDGAWRSSDALDPGALAPWVAYGAIGIAAPLWLAARAGRIAGAVRIGAVGGLLVVAGAGFGLHHPASLVWPLAAVHALEARAVWRADPRDRRVALALAAWALALPVSTVGWLGHALSSPDDVAARSTLVDEERAMVAWAAERSAAGCVVWPADAPIARFAARVRGPADPLRGERTGELRAAAIRAAACPLALVRIGDGDGADDRTITSRYRPADVIAPRLVVGRRRRARATPSTFARWMEELSPRRAADACAPSLALLEAPDRWIVSDDRRARIDGDDLLLRASSSRPVHAHARVAPCAGACLFAEVGLDGERGEAHVTVETLRGGRRRVLVDRAIGPGWRRPIHAPLELDADGWIGWSVSGASRDDLAVRVHRPRVGPCPSLVDLTHLFHHSDAWRATPGAGVEVIGDELRIDLRPVHRTPPRVEVPLSPALAEAGPPCLSVDLSSTRADGTGVMVGVRRGREVRWLERAVLQAADGLHEVREASLASFVGEDDTWLVFSGWPIGGERPGRAIFHRAQIYRCGREPLWPF